MVTGVVALCGLAIFTMLGAYALAEIAEHMKPKSTGAVLCYALNGKPTHIVAVLDRHGDGWAACGAKMEWSRVMFSQRGAVACDRCKGV